MASPSCWGILPLDLSYKLEPVRRYGFILLLGILFLLPNLGFDVIGLLIFQPLQTVFALFTRAGLVFF